MVVVFQAPLLGLVVVAMSLRYAQGSAVLSGFVSILIQNFDSIDLHIEVDSTFRVCEISFPPLDILTHLPTEELDRTGIHLYMSK